MKKTLTGCTAWLLQSLIVINGGCVFVDSQADPQPNDERSPIRLGAGTLRVADGVDESLIIEPQSDEGDADEIVHFLLQYDGPLSTTDREAVAIPGVRLLEPLSGNAYYASASRSVLRLNSQRLGETPYRAAAAIPPEYKIMPALRSAFLDEPVVPPHAQRGPGEIAVKIIFHADVDATGKTNFLTDNSQLITKVETQLPLLDVQIAVQIALPIENLLEVAAHDHVKSINYVRPPPEVDNDTIRSSSGVDSDSVTTTYGLSGAGVTIGQWEDAVVGQHADFDGRLTIGGGGSPSDHATHVAGTMIGSGQIAWQWRGVAAGVNLRSYDHVNLEAEYPTAASNNVTISNNSWGFMHCHRISSFEECYDDRSLFYDKVISGRDDLGYPTTIANRILIIGSSGNEGLPERYVDLNGSEQYDPDEPILLDNDDSGTFSDGDTTRQGSLPNIPSDYDPPLSLLDFASNERHTEPCFPGTFEHFPNCYEIIYRDVDDSGHVSVNDIRLNADTSGPDPVPGPAGSVVAAGDPDIQYQLGDIRPNGTTVALSDSDVGYLGQFRFWGTIRRQNSAKNTITVGNYVSDAGFLEHHSGRGPTRDGRLKPDIVGPGSQYGGDGGVTSTVPVDLYEVNAGALTGGTSFATPAVSGVAALLTEWYRDACRAGDPKPSTLRAMLLHSATDIVTINNYAEGIFAGPDYAYGYGAVNAPSAMAVMPHHVEGIVTSAQVGDVNSHNYQIVIGSVQDLKVTLAWDDPPWGADTPRRPATGLLWNDLDLEIVSPGGTIYTPWQLNSARPFEPAVPSPGYADGTSIPFAARDRRNTVEQIVIPNATPGTWTIRVIASTLDRPDQDYSIVSDFIEPDLSPCTPNPVASVWLRDGPSGSSPSTSSPMAWLSSDIWNKNDGIPRSRSRGFDAHEDPVFGERNALYVRVRNDSSILAKANSVDIWAAPVSTAPNWPRDFEFIGRLPAPNLAAGETRIIGPLEWVPERRSGTDHLALFARAVGPQDPIGIAESASAVSNASLSSNIALRNVHVLDVHQRTAFTSFLLGGIHIGPLTPVDLSLRLRPGQRRRSAGVEVALHIAPTLQMRWIQSGAPGSGFTVPNNRYDPIVLTSDDVNIRLLVDPARPEEHIVRAEYESSTSRRRGYEVDIIQRFNGQNVGGIRYLVYTGRRR